MSCAFLSLALSLASSGLQMPMPPSVICPEPCTRSFQLEDGHVVVSGGINGKSGYRMMIDTGTPGGGTIRSDLAKSLHLKVLGEMLVGDPSGKNGASVKLYEIPEMNIGKVRFRKLTVMEETRRKLGGPNRPSLVVGLGAYESLLLVLDFPHRSMTLSRDKMPARNNLTLLQMTPDHGIFSVPVTVGAERCVANIDTGSNRGLVIPKRIVGRLPLIGTPKVVGTAETAFNRLSTFEIQLKGKFRLGKITLKSPRLETVDRLPNVGIGTRFLSNYVIYLDQRSQMVALGK